MISPGTGESGAKMQFTAPSSQQIRVNALMTARHLYAGVTRAFIGLQVSKINQLPRPNYGNTQVANKVSKDPNTTYATSPRLIRVLAESVPPVIRTVCDVRGTESANDA